MIERLGKSLSRIAERYLPDPFVLAVLLTFLVLVVGLLTALWGQPVAQIGPTTLTILASWKDYLFEPKNKSGGVIQGYLYFAFQMCLMLVTGYALAYARPVRKMIESVSRFPKDSPTAVAMVAFISCVAALLHWGLGVVIGALLAREVARSGRRNGLPMHYPLLGAAGYTALLVWHGGLSGSIPLKATKGIAYAAIAPIPQTDTTFSTLNIMLSLLLLVAIPLFCYLLHPKSRAAYVPFDPQRHLSADDDVDHSDGTLAMASPPTTWSRIMALLVVLGISALFLRHIAATSHWLRWAYTLLNGALVYFPVHFTLRLLHRAWTRPPLERQQPLPTALGNSRVLSILLGWLGLAMLEIQLATGYAEYGFNLLNFSFLFLGILFQETPHRYLRAITNGTASCSGIILQFPFYFGILGMMKVSGLAALITTKLAAISSPTTYPVVTFFSAGIVNLFVPSGGGQWIVQGEIVIKGAQALVGGSHPDLIGKSVMALSYGDAWTNMLQPFWAIPLLAITRLKAREIIGYSAAIMLLSGVVYVAALLLF